MTRTSSTALRVAKWCVALASIAAAAGSAWVLIPRWADRHPAYLDLPRAQVSKVDLRPTVLAGGGIDTARKTVVECDLEAYYSQAGHAGGISTILELVDDGAMVQEGQMIARIDASDYEELARQHEILVLMARADEQKTRLDLRTAEIALAEYRDGQLPLLRQTYESQIVLFEADIRRASDRLAWVDKMVAAGYLSAGQSLSDRAILDRSRVNLDRVKGELATLDAFSSAVEIRRLELTVERFRGELDFQGVRLQHREDQHRKILKQVESCTIRAPHAGMVIYATTYNPNARVEPGAMAYNRMNLFYLPDLSQCEAKVVIHETDFPKVKVGQAAKVRLEALPGRVFEGHIKSIDRLALEPRQWWLSREVRNFSAVVAIHGTPRGLLPGMSAEVEIQADVRPSSLVVPSSSVAVERGQDVVYVVGPSGLERRPVAIDSGDSRNVEVRSGLAEGEEVLLDPMQIGPDPGATPREPASQPTH